MGGWANEGKKETGAGSGPIVIYVGGNLSTVTLASQPTRTPPPPPMERKLRGVQTTTKRWFWGLRFDERTRTLGEVLHDFSVLARDDRCIWIYLRVARGGMQNAAVAILETRQRKYARVKTDFEVILDSELEPIEQGPQLLSDRRAREAFDSRAALFNAPGMTYQRFYAYNPSRGVLRGRVGMKLYADLLDTENSCNPKCGCRYNVSAVVNTMPMTPKIEPYTAGPCEPVETRATSVEAVATATEEEERSPPPLCTKILFTWEVLLRGTDPAIFHPWIAELRELAKRDELDWICARVLPYSKREMLFIGSGVGSDASVRRVFNKEGINGMFYTESDKYNDEAMLGNFIETVYTPCDFDDNPPGYGPADRFYVLRKGPLPLLNMDLDQPYYDLLTGVYHSADGAEEHSDMPPSKRAKLS